MIRRRNFILKYYTHYFEKCFVYGNGILIFTVAAICLFEPCRIIFKRLQRIVDIAAQIRCLCAVRSSARVVCCFGFAFAVLPECRSCPIPAAFSRSFRLRKSWRGISFGRSFSCGFSHSHIPYIRFSDKKTSPAYPAGQHGKYFLSESACYSVSICRA